MQLPVLLLFTSSAHAGFQFGLPRTKPALNAAIGRAPTAAPYMYLPWHTPPIASAPKNIPAKSARVASRPILVPLLSYGGLGAVCAGASKLVGVSGYAGATIFGLSMPVATMAAIAAPAVFLLLEFKFLGGGERVAKSMGGVPADERLTRLASDVAERAGLEPPAHVYEIPTPELNAFAAGFGKGDATVAVTSGLRQKLNDVELEAVIAHEIGHIRHEDMRTNMHVAVAIAGLGGIYEMGRILARTEPSSEKKKDKDDDSGSVVPLGLAMMVGGMAARFSAHLLQLSMSRSAEYDADMVAAELVGSDAMISALKKIQDVTDAKKNSRVREPVPALSSFRGGAFAQSYISSGVATDETDAGSKKNGKMSWWEQLLGVFRTHPTTEKRIEALQARYVLPPSKNNGWF